jgi:hypothetical protein
MVLMSEDRLVKKVYRIRRAAEAQGKDKKNWCYYTKLLLEQLGLGHVWQSEDIGASKVVCPTSIRQSRTVRKGSGNLRYNTNPN